MKYDNINLKEATKEKSNFHVNWDRLFSITIRVILIFLVILAIVFIKHKIDLNNYYLNNF